MKKFSFDTEVFPNYFLAVFYNPQEQHVFEFFNSVDPEKAAALDELLKQELTLYSWNGRGFDNPVLDTFLTTRSLAQTFDKCNDIITSKNRPNNFTKPLRPNITDVDMASMLNAKVPLKLIGAKLNYPNIEEIPVSPGSTITPSQTAAIVKYCINDCKITWTASQSKQVYNAVAVRQTLVKLLNIPGDKAQDIISYAEPTIASSIFPWLVTGGKYSVRENVKYAETVTGHDLIDNKFEFNNQENQLTLNQMRDQTWLRNGELVKSTVTINNCTLAAGGLHSTMKEINLTADDDTAIIDLDVASYYPKLILKYSACPDMSWGADFLKKYKEIHDMRIEAKTAGDKATADALKLLLNSTYGKYRSQYSVFLSPSSQLKVTLNGQCWLSKLIESATNHDDIEMIQANTDGVTFKLPRNKIGVLKTIVEDWEAESGFPIEWNEYKSIFLRDVNNYIAISQSGKIKAIGAYRIPSVFGYGGFTKPLVSILAAQENILHGTDIETFIKAHKNKFDFCLCGKRDKIVDHGYKIYRVYLSNKPEGTITLKAITKVGVSKVPLCENVVDCRNMDNFDFCDVDYQRYIDEAVKLTSLLAEPVKSSPYRTHEPVNDIVEEYTATHGTPPAELLESLQRIPGVTHIKVAPIGMRRGLRKDEPLPKNFNVEVFIPDGYAVFDVDNPAKNTIMFPDSLRSTQNHKTPEKCHVWVRPDKPIYGKHAITGTDGKTIIELFGTGSTITIPPSKSTKSKVRWYKWLNNTPIADFNTTGLSELFNAPDMFTLKTSSNVPYNKDKVDSSLKMLSQNFPEVTPIQKPEGIWFNMPCPLAEEHSDGSSSGFGLCIRPDGEIIIKCLHASHKQIFKLGLERLFPNKKWWAPDCEELDEPIQTIVDCNDDTTVFDQIEAYLPYHNWLSVEAPTGTGKTTAIINYAKKDPSIKIAVILNSVASADDIENRLLQSGIPGSDISRHQRATVNEDGKQMGNDELKRIALIQSAYFLTKGDSAEEYKQLPKWIAGRIIFVDESHLFLKRCEYFVRLSEAYWGDYYQGICPRFLHKADSDPCPCQLVTDCVKILNQNLPEFKAPEIIAKNPIVTEYPSDWFDFSGYTRVGKSLLWIKPLQARQQVQNPANSPKLDYVNYLLRNSRNPQLRVEFPDGERVPKYPCKRVVLCGFNLAPLQKLFAANGKVIFMSATTPNEIKYIPREYNLFSVKLKKVVEKYNTHVFKLQKKLSDSALLKIMRELPTTVNNVPLRGLITLSTKAETKQMIRTISGKIDQRIKKIIFAINSTYFERTIEDFINANMPGFLLTYPKHPCCTGLNMPEKQFVIIDCGLFIPFAAVPEITTTTTPEESWALIKQYINELITQIVGRLFRGEQRNIVVILHNIPAELDPQLDNTICNVTEYTDVKHLAQGNKLAGSLIAAIKEVFDGVAVTNHTTDVIEDQVKNFKGSWRDCSRKFNLSRLPKNVIKTLKEIHKMSRFVALSAIQVTDD